MEKYVKKLKERYSNKEVRQRLSKKLNKLQKSYRDAFTFYFKSYAENSFSIVIVWFSDNEYEIFPEFDPYDMERNLDPVSYNLSGSFSDNATKTLKEIIVKMARTELR